jgi:hypothetical protein
VNETENPDVTVALLRAEAEIDKLEAVLTITNEDAQALKNKLVHAEERQYALEEPD